MARLVPNMIWHAVWVALWGALSLGWRTTTSAWQAQNVLVHGQRSATWVHSWRSSVGSLPMSASSQEADLSNLVVMVNGMPGPMATAAAEACLRKNLKLAPIGLTGPEVEPCTISVVDPGTSRRSDVKLIPATQLDEFEAALDGLRAAVGGAKNVVAIDFTHPSAVNANAEMYVRLQLPFVMGTTGGDREKLLQDVGDANHFAVIAPNMAKQIVAMQAALEDLASKYPAAFDSYELKVVESHQKSKADTSGTAKAVVSSLKTLSNSPDFDAGQDIVKLRTDEDSMAFGVPQEGLDGHAWHTYTLTSPDGSVVFELKHNVVGRSVYADGTADAAKFLARKIQTESVGKIYTMINVLEEGAME